MKVRGNDGRKEEEKDRVFERVGVESNERQETESSEGWTLNKMEEEWDDWRREWLGHDTSKVIKTKL